MRILLIEDHSRLADSITKGLARLGFGADAFATAAEGINAIKLMTYDAIVLDLGLPDRDGLEVLRELRRKSFTAPVLILTARDSVEDRVTGLDAGADDYVVKPFAMTELAARLRALLRRPGQSLAATLTVGNLCLDVGARQATVKGAVLHLSAREIEALEILLRREGQVVSRAALEDALYGLGRNVSPNSVEVLISRLRRRLAPSDAGCAIHTLHGIGYLLKEQRS
ncbi:MAG TPA: response regulator transcription factor [Pseudolabrys sp.]|nr:response regulator transcription factor [Pseudolabrys sp.]